MSFEFGQDVMFTELMLYAPMDILEHVAEAQRESILADMQEEDAEIFGESVHVRKSGKSRYDKKAMKRKGSAKRFRDRSRKCASEEHMYSVYSHGEKRSRTQTEIKCSLFVCRNVGLNTPQKEREVKYVSLWI